MSFGLGFYGAGDEISRKLDFDGHSPNLSEQTKQKIIQAANGQLEPYWNLYKQHFKPEVFDLLETMKVGELSDYDPERYSYLKDEYSNEPKRSDLLKIHSSKEI